ncbi:MAG: SGNH/GDSL hydrolase family protein [Bdellovibrionota bacterium]
MSKGISKPRSGSTGEKRCRDFAIALRKPRKKPLFQPSARGLYLMVMKYIVVIAACAIAVLLYLFLSMPGYNTESPGLATQFDPQLGWVTKANLAIAPDLEEMSYSTDSSGFRVARRKDLRTAPDEKKIICLGDSFTFGSGVSDGDTWCNQIQIAGISTINMGVPGYGIDQMLLYYESSSPKLKPWLKIVAFIDEDFARVSRPDMACHPRPTFRLAGGAIEKNPFGPNKISPFRFKACRIFEDSLAEIRKLIPKKFLHESSLDQESFSLCAAILAGFKKGTGPEKLLLVRLPTALGDRTNTKLSRQILDLVKDSKIDFIDLQQKMNELNPSEIQPMFLGANRVDYQHPSVLGHRWIAAQLSQAIELRRRAASSTQSPQP